MKGGQADAQLAQQRAEGICVILLGIDRGIIAGGDTSSHTTLALGVYTLTELAATVPGAALCEAHSDDPANRLLELALKGGQISTPDYFERIKAGGHPISATG